MRDIKISLGDKVIRFRVQDFEDDVNVDKLLKIDYSNIWAEILTFPVIVNRFGILASEMDNLYQEKKLDFSIFESKLRKEIRDRLFEENNKKPTIAEVDDEINCDKKFRIKKKNLFKVLKEKETIYSIYQSAKDKSYKLDKLSYSLKPEDYDESLIEKQLNSISYKIQNAKIK